MRGRILKIKAKKDRWFFDWEVYRKETKRWNQYTLSSQDPPREELKECLAALAEHVAEICELAPEAAENIVVLGITETHIDGNRFLMITGTKKLITSTSPLILNTPLRPEKPGKEITPECCMSERLLAALEILEEEAWRYINGDRAQMSLNFDGREEPAA